jgi:AraC-like DNA-binding protein
VSTRAGNAAHVLPLTERAELRVSKPLIRAIADTVQQLGVAPAVLLGAIAPPGELALPAQISLESFRQLLARAIRLTDQPALGLVCGTHARELSFDLFAPLVSNAQSMRHALELACQFHPLALEGGSLQVTERAGRAIVRCGLPQYDPLVDRVLAELSIAGLMRMLMVYGGSRKDLHAVYFEHERPAHHAAYAAVFGGAERFSQPFTGLELDATALDRPHLHSQPELQALIHAHAERHLSRLGQPPSFVDRLQVALRARPLSQALDMQRVARELGVGVRSLRRRLVEEGTSFREVVELARKSAAFSLLRRPDMTVQATSHALGFANVSAFHRAFKRWTGLTPAQYREQVQADPASR